MAQFDSEYDQEKYLLQSFICSNMSNPIKRLLVAKVGGIISFPMLLSVTHNYLFIKFLATFPLST